MKEGVLKLYRGRQLFDAFIFGKGNGNTVLAGEGLGQLLGIGLGNPSHHDKVISMSRNIFSKLKPCVEHVKL